MKYTDFEKHIGRKLGNAEEPVQMEALLSSLNLLTPEAKRKAFPFWILILIFLVGSIATFMGTNQNASQNLSSRLIGSKTSNDSSKLAQNTENAKGSHDKHIDEIESLSESSENIRNNKTTELVRNSLEESISGKTKNKYKSTTKKNTKKTLKSKNLDKELSPHSQHQEKEPALAAVPIVSKGFFSNFVENQKPISTNTTRESGNYSSFISINENVSFYKPNISMTESRASVDAVPLENKSLAQVPALDQDQEDIFSRMKINCPSFNQAFWRLALVPEVGLFNPYKTLEQTSGEASFDFDQRSVNEESLEGINIGLYGMLVRDRLPVFLKAGVSYSRISERINLDYQDTSYITEIGIISSTVSANGDTITHIYGDVVSEVISEVKTKQHNYIHLFDLPVSVGYNSYILGFDVGIEAGVKINLMTRATGNLFTGDAEFTNLSLNRYFKPKIGLSYFGGLMIGRNFGRFGDFYLAPRFHYYPDDFSSSINTISQKYVTLGINAGFVYKIK